MPVTLVATAGAANANSYLTLIEAQAYFDTRFPLPGWVDTDVNREVLLMMATRIIDSLAQPLKTFIPGTPPYYRVRPQWTGAPATTTQRLAWPRTGMFDRNGNAIASNVIPIELKEATAELAGQLGLTDRTLDNDVIVQGLTSVKAGSVSLSFKDSIMPKVIPDAVYNLLVQSWLTDELYVQAGLEAEFDVVSGPPGGCW